MRELLKNRSAMIIWLSRTFSRFGDAFESLALMYLVFEITDSALAMGTVMIFSVVPNIIVSPFAGVIGDRYNKKKIMFIAEMVRTITMLLIPVLHFMGCLQIGYIYVIAVVVSIAESFFEPCAQVAMTVVVEKEQLALYDSVITTSNNIARMIGYSLSGIAMSFLTKDIVFVIDAITFAVSAISVVYIKLPDIALESSEEEGGVFKDMHNALRYILKTTMIPIILMTITLNGVLLEPEGEFLPIIIEDLLRIDTSWAGIFMTILSLGSLGASIIFPIITKTKLQLRQLILVGQIVIGALFILVFIKTNIVTGIILYIVLGFLSSLISMWSSMKIQYICKIEYMARISSIFTMAMLISDPFAAFIYGWLIDSIQISNIFLMNGILFIGFGILIYILMLKATFKSKDDEVSIYEEESFINTLKGGDNYE